MVSCKNYSVTLKKCSVGCQACSVISAFRCCMHGENSYNKYSEMLDRFFWLRPWSTIRLCYVIGSAGTDLMSPSDCVLGLIGIQHALFSSDFGHIKDFGLLSQD